MTARHPHAATDGVVITNAIPYVNGDPHLGHALGFVQADVLARHARRRGCPVTLLGGTDDNAAKNVAAARAVGQPTATFVAGRAARFRALVDALDVSVDGFVSTSIDSRHRIAVERAWRRSAAKGDFYRRAYRGLYCPGCEQFYDPIELLRPPDLTRAERATCREHGDVVHEVAETNWFFRLSRYAPRIEDAIRSGALRISPAERAHEVLAWLGRGVGDISVSRPAARVSGWGVSVPDDPDQVVYVWWDALTNYLTGLGYGTDEPAFDRWWRQSRVRAHVIGKGILRFHAVYWPALLLSIGEPLPTELLVHEYLTVAGSKIAKSSGVRVDPLALLDEVGSDALRWWLLSDVARLGDTDFDPARLARRYAQDLAGGVGNLIRRCSVLAARSIPAEPVLGGADPLLQQASRLPHRIDAALEAYDLRRATRAVVELVDAANRRLEEDRPWERPADDPRRRQVLTAALGAAAVVADELAPFLPAASPRLRAALATAWSVPAAPVFPPLRQAQPCFRCRYSDQMLHRTDLLTIGELAERSGVAPSALRYYEAQRLITATRTTGNQRRYQRATLRRIAFVRSAQRVGLSLEEISEALATLPGGRTPTKADWARLSRAWRPRLEAQIDRLERLRDRLDSCIGCGCLSLGRCSLQNPDDEVAARGPGAVYLEPQQPRP